MDRWMGGWTGGWMDGWIGGLIGGWMDRSKPFYYGIPEQIYEYHLLPTF